MPLETRQHGSRVWTKGRIGLRRWDDERGALSIVPITAPPGWLLISWDAELPGGSERTTWTKRFARIEDAMEFAETI